MNDNFATLAAYLITAVGLWLGTRKSKVRYIRWQWRRPYWILLRLLILVLVIHFAFVLLGIRTVIGFPCLGLLVASLAIGLGFEGFFFVAAVGAIFHEWVFWLPSRRQLILRNPRPVKRASRSQMIGLEGVALSDLKPTGKISIGGVEHTARSEWGVISKGGRVVVESAGDFELKVKQAERP